MNPPPRNFPRISSALYYDDAKAAIDWLCNAFGFEVQIKVEGDEGSIEHSELVFGGGLIMVSSTKPRWPFMRSPRQAGGNTQNLFVYVDDIQAHHDRAVKAGAKIIQPVELHDYGEEHWADRGYGCEDVGGHHWWFAQRMRGLIEEPASTARGGARRAEHA
jgi:uncharacterized glyoxalase superfamily protein PhnB